MTLKALLDMNLSPDLIDDLRSGGWEASHWSRVGLVSASDHTIMHWARNNDYVVVSHDLDFGDILASSNSNKPSVILVRTQDLLGEDLSGAICAALEQHQEMLAIGALIIITLHKMRVRVLPLQRTE
jgi:predicted nuclease of predicted toxin-antitoxin system